MPKESELAKKATEAVKAIDKLARDIRKDMKKVLEIAKELREMGSGGEKPRDGR